MPAESPQVVIIGAGPAGSTAAIRLARAGWRVMLVEQHRFPRDKVCGECLSALGIEVLDRLRLADALRHRFRPVIFTRAHLHSPDGSTASLPLPRPMWGISRRQFDEFLLHEARDAGAQLLQPARCEGIDERTDAVSVHVRRLETNTIEILHASVVLLADGKAGVLPARPKPTRDLGVKAHFADVKGPREAIELFGVRGCYGGIAAVEDGRWNVAFSIPQDRLRWHDGDAAALFAEMTSENETLRARLRTARRVTEWLAAPLPRFNLTARISPRVIPLGNAAAAIEPIGGEGMGLAMRSAELAASELIAAHREHRPADTDQLRSAFDRLWRTRQLTCRIAALAVSSPRLSNAGLGRLGASGALGGLALRWMGK